MGAAAGGHSDGRSQPHPPPAALPPTAAALLAAALELGYPAVAGIADPPSSAAAGAVGPVGAAVEQLQPRGWQPEGEPPCAAAPRSWSCPDLSRGRPSTCKHAGGPHLAAPLAADAAAATAAAALPPCMPQAQQPAGPHPPPTSQHVLHGPQALQRSAAGPASVGYVEMYKPHEGMQVTLAPHELSV